MAKDNFKENPLKKRRKKKKDSELFSTTKPTLEITTEVSADVNHNEIINLKNPNFDYEELDNDTEEFLKTKEYQIHELGKEFYTKLGKLLSDTKSYLEKQGYGLFSEWCESLGFSRRQAYRLINRYQFIIEQSNIEKQKRLENMPLSLVYELLKSTTPKELKEKALNGEITTYTEFMRLKEDLLDNGEDDKEKKKKGPIIISKKKLENRKGKLMELMKDKIGDGQETIDLVEQIIGLLFNDESWKKWPHKRKI